MFFFCIPGEGVNIQRHFVAVETMTIEAYNGLGVLSAYNIQAGADATFICKGRILIWHDSGH
ncbi:MAG: hypothetical protein AAGA77_03990 [Bacteroidota bacterium]